MKTFTCLSIIAVLLTAVAPAATSRKLMNEMEDYAKDILRAHPELAGDKRKKDAANDMVQQAGRDGIFELNETEEKLLRRRKEIVKQSEYDATVGKMKSLGSKDPKVTFLLKYAEQPRIKPAEKLLAFRLMQRDYAKAAEAAANRLNQQMTTILGKYADYKKQHNKPPANLGELNLPDDAKQFINSKGQKVDWIYIGHLGPVLQAEGSHIVLAAPEPIAGARLCGMDNGKTGPFKESSIKPSLDKVLQGAKDGTIQPGGTGTNAGSTALATIMKKIDLFKDLNNDKIPDSLAELELEEADKNYTDPATGEKSPWIYLGNASRIRVSEKVKVIIVAPKAHRGKRLAGLSDGKIATLDEKQIAPMLNR